MSDYMAAGEVLGYTWDEERELQEQEEQRLIEAEEKAEKLICTAEGLIAVDDFSQYTVDVHADLARAFRNLTDAFAGKQYAIDACLQALLNIRNRCRDDAIRMVLK